MRKEWDAGHIIMPMPSHYDDEKWQDHTMEQGVRFVPPDEHKPAPKNSYLSVMDDIRNRPPVPPHSV